MANIKPYTDQISSARYGEQVRGSIVNALTAMNDQINDDTASAGAYAQDAAASAASADTTAEGLVDTLAEFETKITAFDTAESLRVTAEQNRVTAEQARAVAELARENEETGYVAQARGYAEQAAQHASSDNARLSESWAIGGTGVRYGEDISNSKYFSDQSQAWATGGTSGTPSATNNAKYWSDQAEERADERGQYWDDKLATTGESWTQGGTGTRQGEDTNNAKYWSEQAYHWYEEAGEVVTEGGVSPFNGRNGVVVPESGDYTQSMIPRGTGTVESSLQTIEAGIATLNGDVSDLRDDLTDAQEDIQQNATDIGLLDTSKVDKSDAILNLDTTQAPTTIDGALYDAIDKLGWDAVISSQLMNLKKLLTNVLNQVTPQSATVAINSSYAYGSGQLGYLYKNGNVVTFYTSALKNIPNSTVTLCTIPAGWRPKQQQDVIVFEPNAAGASRAVRIIINTDGSVTCYGYGDYSSATLINVRIHIAFVCA